MPVIKYKYYELSLEKIGFLLFLIGVFALPSSFFLGIIFLFPAGIISTFRNAGKYLKDKWNNYLFLVGSLLILSTILQKILFYDRLIGFWDHSLSIYGLANWLPLFWIFYCSQSFLDSASKRKIFITTSICGSFPILLTGFGQYFFDWHGPFQTLNGLIVWYQRPIIEPGGLTGLFNHQNYAGSWLNFIWPFSIALVLDKSKNRIRKSVAICFLVAIGTAAFLTSSRNSWLGLITSLPIMIGIDSLTLILPILLIAGFAIMINIFSPELIGTLVNAIPNKIQSEFSNEGYQGLDVTRFEILISAIKISLIRPIIGLGAASFTVLYHLENGFWKGHSHNFFLELAISYGYPAAIILLIIISSILIATYKKIFLELKERDNNLIYDRALWVSALVFFISQNFDIQYFDGRISLFIWIILAGLKNITQEEIVS